MSIYQRETCKSFHHTNLIPGAIKYNSMKKGLKVTLENVINIMTNDPILNDFLLCVT